ncbi:integrin beta-PS-like [Zerene cesonia]|uniref:integrin beta-PS-like n=1 Tax=Zerene cesonia TaxID=33412 RepID=UPI0018E58A77|nr:integrin beta-PS-like [Zerene cesonia]
MCRNYISFTLLIFSIVISTAYFKIVSLDKNWICGIKKSCVDCLQVHHCSWCPSQNKCFSESSPVENPCNDSLHSANYEMSLLENAECACGIFETRDNNCRPPGVTDGPECYGRGSCVCGRCFCDPNPDPENPSKVIIGEHCEFDNFSCDGPKCNEGPFSINDLHLYEEDNADDVPEVDLPVEK